MVGGMRTKWLFPEDLANGKDHLVEIAGTGEHKGKTGKTVPYLVLLGSINGTEVLEWQLCEWRVQSKEEFDPAKGGKFLISRYGNDVLFKPEQQPR